MRDNVLKNIKRKSINNNIKISENKAISPLYYNENISPVKTDLDVTMEMVLKQPNWGIRSPFGKRINTYFLCQEYIEK